MASPIAIVHRRKSESNGAPVAQLLTKPYTSYTIFFRLEQAYILQSSGIIGEEVLACLDPTHHDPLEHPRPAKYRDLVLPPYWYSSAHKAAVEKKRKHRKRAGRMDMKTLSKTIAASWRNVNNIDVVKYCEKLAAAELKIYKEICLQFDQHVLTRAQDCKEVPRSKPEPEETRREVISRVNGQQLLSRTTNMLVSPSDSRSIGATKTFNGRRVGQIPTLPTRSKQHLELVPHQPKELPLSNTRTELAIDKDLVEVLYRSLVGGSSSGGVQGGAPTRSQYSNGFLSQQSDEQFAAYAYSMSRRPNQNDRTQCVKESILAGYGHSLAPCMLPPRLQGGTHHAMLSDTKKAACESMLLLASQAVREPASGAACSSSCAMFTPNTRQCRLDARRTPDTVPSIVKSSNVQDQDKPARTLIDDLKQQEEPESSHAVSLFTRTDDKVLDPVHLYPRCHCIELFVKSQSDPIPGKAGRVGLRCFYCKASCFPLKRETIYDNVLKFQQYHLEVCPSIPEKMKAKYRTLVEQDYCPPPKKLSDAFLKAYYAEAAREIGIVNSPDGGLIFGAPQNMSGVPSKRLRAFLEGAGFHGM